MITTCVLQYHVCEKLIKFRVAVYGCVATEFHPPKSLSLTCLKYTTHKYIELQHKFNSMFVKNDIIHEVLINLRGDVKLSQNTKNCQR